MDAFRRRVKDIETQLPPLTVHEGQGDNDRVTTVPVTLTPWLQNPRAGGSRRYIRTMQPRLGYTAVATTMSDTHILQPGGQGVPSPLDDLGV